MRSILSFGSFVVLREIWSVSSFGEISVFYTGYRCDSDEYHLDITFVWFVSLFDFSTVFENYGQLRWFLRLPVFRVFEKIGVLTPYFCGFHYDLFDGWKYNLFSFFIIFAGVGSGKTRLCLFPFSTTFSVFPPPLAPNLFSSLVDVIVDRVGPMGWYISDFSTWEVVDRVLFIIYLYILSITLCILHLYIATWIFGPLDILGSHELYK